MEIKCPNCKYEGLGEYITKGSIWIEVALWIIFLLPGLIYTIWRLSNRIWICPKCDFQNVTKEGDPTSPQVNWRFRLVLWFIVGLFILFLMSLLIPDPNKEDTTPEVNYKTIIEKQTVLAPQRKASDPAEWEGWEQAEETVKNLPCSEGGTVDQYLTGKATISVIEDLGWITTPWEGGFYVERLLLVEQTISMFYRWQVDRTGKAKPVNDKAIRITRKTKDTVRGLKR